MARQGSGAGAGFPAAGPGPSPVPPVRDGRSDAVSVDQVARVQDAGGVELGLHGTQRPGESLWPLAVVPGPEVPPDRVFLNFVDMPRAHWGWNGKAFA